MNNNNKDQEKEVMNIQDNKVESGTRDEEKKMDQILYQVENRIVSSTKTQCLPTKSRSVPSADNCLVIDVAFDARQPSYSDFHGIKKLLQRVFMKCENEEVSELSNLVVAQDFVGCVLKQDREADSDDDSEDSNDEEDYDEDDDVYAVSTVINISENKNLSCIKKMCDLLIEMCNENYKEDPSRMADLIGDPTKQIGLIISERFINIPPQVALPSYQSLKSDIEKAVRKNRKFDFTHLVLISKMYRGQCLGKNEDDLFFCNPEEQLFKEVSEFSYTFSVADQSHAESDGSMSDEKAGFESLHTVMVFKAKALGQMILKLQKKEVMYP